jgi:hypothetical protein
MTSGFSPVPFIEVLDDPDGYRLVVKLFQYLSHRFIGGVLEKCDSPHNQRFSDGCGDEEETHNDPIASHQEHDRWKHDALRLAGQRQRPALRSSERFEEGDTEVPEEDLINQREYHRAYHDTEREEYNRCCASKGGPRVPFVHNSSGVYVPTTLSLRVFGWGSLDFTSSVLLLFLLNTLLLSVLGREPYGVYVLANALWSSCSLFSVGLGDTTSRLVAASKGDERRIATYSSASVILTLGISAPLALSLWSAAPTFVDLFGIRDQAAEALSAFRAAALVLFAASIDRTLRSISEGRGGFGAAAAWSVGFRVSVLVVCLLAAFAGKLTADGVLTVTAGLLLLTAAGRSMGVRWRAVAPREIFHAAREFPRAVAALSLNAGISLISLNVDGVLLGIAEGPEASALYAPCLQLALVSLHFSARTGSHTLPLASAVAHDRIALSALYWRTTLLFFAIHGLWGVILCVGAPWILGGWLGAEFARDASGCLRLLAITTPFMSAAMIPVQMAHAVWKGVKWSVAAHGIHIATMAALQYGVASWGIEWVAAARGVSFVYAWSVARKVEQTVGLPRAGSRGIATLGTVLIIVWWWISW